MQASCTCNLLWRTDGQDENNVSPQEQRYLCRWIFAELPSYLKIRSDTLQSMQEMSVIKYDHDYDNP